ncbi:MAG: hypothetical protein ABJG41_10450 [Cyclobacteriaceae bacterium]
MTTTLRFKGMISLMCASLLCLTTLHAQTTVPVTASTDDGTVSDPAVVTSNNPYTLSSLKIGSSDVNGAANLTSAIIPFELPDIPEGNVITDVELTLHVSFGRQWANCNVDLYGLGYQSTSTISSADHFAGDFGDGTGNGSDTGIQDDFFTKNVALGELDNARDETTDATGNANLLAYINAQYGAGAMAGDFVFLRLSVDNTSMTGSQYFNVDDGAGASPAVLSITYQSSGANQLPVLATVGDQSIAANDFTNVLLSASDPDDDNNTLVFSGNNLPAFASVVNNNDGTANLQLDPALIHVGVYSNVEIVVSDGEDTDTEMIEITVTDGVTVEINPTSDGYVSDPSIITTNNPYYQGFMKLGKSAVDGSSNLTSAIMPFELPEIPAGKVISDASLKVYVSYGREWVTTNIDLYGLDYDASPTLSADDHFAGDFGDGSGTGSDTGIEDDYFTKNVDNGTLDTERYEETSEGGNANLVTYLEAQIAAGADAGDYVFLRLSVENTDVAGAHYFKIEGEDSEYPAVLSITYVSAPAIVWNGSASSDWDNASNWDGGEVPAEGDNVEITNLGNSPVIGSDVAIVGLSIADNATLTIATGNTLTVSGDLVADLGVVAVSSGASLITEGVVTGDSHTITRSTTFTDVEGRYSAIGSPVADAMTDVLGSLVYRYNEDIAYVGAQERFEEVSTPELMSKGDAYFSAFTGDVVFTGTPNTGDIAVPIVNTGFNLVSNPYPSAISYDDLLAGNPVDPGNSVFDGTIYLWDDGGSDNGQRSNSDYITANSMGAASNGSGRSGDWNGYIGSAQGFMINSAIAGDLYFDNSMRAIGNNSKDSYFRKSGRDFGFETLKMSLNDNKGQASEMLIGFAEDATLGVDGAYDALQMSTSPLKLYSLIEDTPFTIQGLPFGEELIVPLGYDVVDLSDYTINLQNVTNWTSGFNVVLEDHELGTSKVLTAADASYHFTATSLSSNSRFYLKLTTSSVLAARALSGLELLPTLTGVTISGLYSEDGAAQLIITDISGKLLKQARVSGGSNAEKVDFDFAQNQIYILRLRVNQNESMMKVLFK